MSNRCRSEGICYPSKYCHLPPFGTTQVPRHMIRNLIFCNTINVDQGRFRSLGHVCTVNKVTGDVHIDWYIDTIFIHWRWEFNGSSWNSHTMKQLEKDAKSNPDLFITRSLSNLRLVIFGIRILLVIYWALSLLSVVKPGIISNFHVHIIKTL